MDSGAVVTIICAVLAGGFFSFIERLIDRHDKIKNAQGDMDKLWRALDRIQLMVLMSDYSERSEEIVEVGEHYFVKLKGDWFMHNLFLNYLRQHKLPRPKWFKKEDEE